MTFLGPDLGENCLLRLSAEVCARKAKVNKCIENMPLCIDNTVCLNRYYCKGMGYDRKGPVRDLLHLHKGLPCLLRQKRVFKDI